MIKDEFLKIARRDIKRPGIEKMLEWLESTDFFTAPASSRYHGAFEGGLAVHSLNVLHRLKGLANFYGIEASEESMAIVALFHDVCKVGCYKVSTRNVKNDETGRWEKVPFYKFDEDFSFGGHGSKSMYLVQHFMELSPEEAVAINCHMGPWDRPANDFSLGSAYQAYPLAWALHVADEATSYFDKT